jgi:DNA replication protein DnaC
MLPGSIARFLCSRNFAPTKTIFDLRERCKSLDLAIRRGFFIWGDRGTGKTIAASSLACWLIAREIIPVHTVGFLSAVDICSRFAGYELDRIIHSAMACGVLIIDDMGAEKRFHDRIESIIASRYDRLGITIITSNLPPNKLSDIYDLRIVDRIVSTTINIHATERLRNGI